MSQKETNENGNQIDRRSDKDQRSNRDRRQQTGEWNKDDRRMGERRSYVARRQAAEWRHRELEN